MDKLKKCTDLCHELKKTTKSRKEIFSKYEDILPLFHYYCFLTKNKDLYQILKQYYFDPFKGTVTLTYGDVAESHVGMQKIGQMAEKGFQLEDLLKAKTYFEEKGSTVHLITLNDFLPKEEQNKAESAYLLVIRDGLKHLINDDKGHYLLTETQFFTWDAKLWNKRRKIVQNKNARHNLNFSDHKQVADFQNGKGTTIPWSDVPMISLTRKKLKDAFGDSAKDLKCEGNLYYDSKKTGIGYHGDTERRKVIGVRLGKEMTIHYMWYRDSKPAGVNMSMKLNPGDIYCMSEKAVGTDWMKKKIYTLRHAAGASIYTTNTPNIILSNPRTKGDITIYDIKLKKEKEKEYSE